MTVVFADTSYYIARLNPSDEDYERAVELTSTRAVRIVTTEWVLSELASYLSSVVNRRRFVGLLQDIRADLGMEIIGASNEDFSVGFDLYADRLDKQWSLMDCIYFT